MTSPQSASVEEGNTKTSSTPSKTPDCKARGWIIVINNYTDNEVASLNTFINDHKTRMYAYQSEIGDSGTPHIQGAIWFADVMRQSTLKKSFPRAHLEVIHNKQAALEYARKDKTWDGKIRKNAGLRPKILSPLQGKELFPFQKDVLNIFEEKCEDDRKIHWFWEREGCKGKTSIAKHLCIEYPDILYVSGAAKDIKCAVVLWMKEHESSLPRGFIFNYPRESEGYVSYAALEEIKDGFFFSPKYESGQCIFNPVPVVCFANFSPKLKGVSADRWIIHDLNDEPT